MCFGSKMKVPKPVPEQLKAPEPVLLEPPKGIEVGDGSDDSDTNDSGPSGRESVTVTKTGEGTQSAVSTDTGAASTTSSKKATKSPAISRALKKA